MGNAEVSRRPLRIRGAFTWHTGTHELFDYDNNSQTETVIYPSTSGFLQRKGLELQYSQLERAEWETLFQIDEPDGRVVRIVDGATPGEQREQLWMVLQQNCSFILNEGDTLKLGKMVVTVKEIVLSRDQSECTMMETKVPDCNHNMDLVEARSGRLSIIQPAAGFLGRQGPRSAASASTATTRRTTR